MTFVLLRRNVAYNYTSFPFFCVQQLTQFHPGLVLLDQNAAVVGGTVKGEVVDGG